MFKHIRTRFTVTNTLMAALVTVVIGVVSYVTTSQQILHYQERELRATAESLANFSIYFLSNTRNNLRQIAEAPAIEKYNISFNEEVLIQHFASTRSQFSAIAFVNNNGKEEIKMVYGEVSEDYLNVSDFPVYLKATQVPNTVQIGSPRYSETLRTPTLDFGYQRVSYFKEKLGLIRGTILLSAFAEQIETNQIPALTLITDATGHLIYAPQTDLLTQSLKARSDTSRTLLSLNMDHKQTVFAKHTILNRACFVVTTTIPEFGWHIVVAIPVEMFLAPLHQLRNTIGIVSLVVMLLTLIFAYVLGKAITSPILEIKNAAQKIGAGDLNTRIDIPSKDEIGALASSFNQMVEDLASANQALKSTQAQLIQSGKMASLGELATGIAHEINQPLTYINTKVQTLQLDIEKDRADLAQVLTTLKAFKDRIKRITAIITHLRSLGREQKKEFARVHLKDVLKDTLLLLTERMRLNNIQLQQNLAAELPPLIGQPYQLEQVFINLIQNAMDVLAEQKGGIISLHAVHLAQQQKIEIRITDNGPGVPLTALERIFDPFYTTKSEGKGTGLGLSISHGIIQAHHGEIHCQSEPGQGATFIIRLPTESTL